MNNPFLNKKILIIGFGKSGYSLANVLVSLHARIIINEKSDLSTDAKAQNLKQKGVTIISGGHPLSLAEQKFDYVVKNPGIPYDNPLVVSFLVKGVEILTEIELGYMIQNNLIIGITGSNGKTTTTTLTREFLIQDGKSAKSAGNIGKVFTEVIHNSHPNDIIVSELSSFQLMGTKTFRPKISLLLNIYGAHLDYHGDIDSYVNAKAKIVENQLPSDYCIYNFDNPLVREIAKKTQAKRLAFSTFEPDAFAFFDGETFYIDQKPVIHINSVKLKGKHNIENILASLSVAKLLGVQNKTIHDTLSRFNGVEHRLQYVETFNGRKFYNDSKATNLFSTQTAISSFKEPVIVLMGGLDRGVDFSSFSNYFNRTKAVVTFGQVSEKIKEASTNPATLQCSTIEEAVQQAYELSEDGDVILLSPGCASWDQYRSFEERGYDFINQVQSIRTNLSTQK